MQEKSQSRTAPYSPESAARLVRRGAASIRAGAQGLSQYRTEYQSLIDWADLTGRQPPFGFIEQFDFVWEDKEGSLNAVDLIIGPPGESMMARFNQLLQSSGTPF